MMDEEIFEGEVDVRYLFLPAQRHSSLLLVTFSSFPELDMSPQYDFVDCLEEFDCNRLYLLDDFGCRGSYYLCRNKDYDIEGNVVRLIDWLCGKHGVVRKIALGVDEGGTAAVYYGIKYDFDTVIVESPHFYIGRNVRGLPDANDILSFMGGDCKEDTVEYFDGIMGDVISSKEVCRTKVIVCANKDVEESFQSIQIQHLVDALLKKRVPYMLKVVSDVSQATNLADLFLLELKKNVTVHGPFPNLIDYVVGIVGDVLTLEVKTSNVADKVALKLFVNGEKIAATGYSEKRKYYFDVLEVGVYQFTVFLINTFEHRRAIKLAKVEVSKESDGAFKWVEIPRKFAKIRTEMRLEKLQKEVDFRFFPSAREKINALPVSNGSRYYNPLAVKIALVADHPLFEAYGQIAQCTYVTPDNYQVVVGKVDVFLVTNTWQGLSYEWEGLADPEGEIREQLVLMVAAFRNSGAKVVFYSEEDPVHYQTFLAIAQLCDYIFTTAKEQVASYQEDCEHERVYTLGLGINPMVHNPIGFRKFKKFPGAIFSGGWDRFSNPESQRDAKMIFDGVIEKNNLKIIDENFKRQQEIRYWFPDKYFRNTSLDTVSEKELQNVYKLFNWAIHINKVKYSNTIASRNLYALQASGNMILSNYNEGINNMFPHVFTIVSKKEVSKIMHGFNEEELYQHQVLGIRKVMSEETNYHRLVEMMKLIGVTIDYPVRKVAVIVKAAGDRVRKMFSDQSYENKELLVESELPDDMLDVFDFVAYFSERADYGDYYLEDMINAFKYVDVDFVTKQAYYLNGKLQVGVHHDYVDSYEDKMRTVFSSKNYQKLSDFDECVGYQGYAVDPFEFRIDEKRPVIQLVERNYKLSVVIPVFNNGDHLLNKAFNSLLRSEIFDSIEVMIIDDGSTDGKTLGIIKRLANKYVNVKTYFYPKGGSGSASRPRNKAIELATAKYIAFLDPDDEMINDGMKKFFEAIDGSCYDMVIGETLVVTHSDIRKEGHFDLVKLINDGSDVVKNTRSYLVKVNLKPRRLQEIVVRKEVITQNKLSMVVGALGQDTLFFHEAILVSKSVKFINDIVGLYYGAVDGSAVNNVSLRLFEKYLIREKEAVGRYTKHGVLNEFLALRYERFFCLWYFPRLKKVSDDEFACAVKTLREIMDVYAPYYTLEHKAMIRFYKLAVNEDYRALREIY